MVNLFQSTIMTNFLYPLLFVFVLVFAILEKTKIFGEKKTQSNAVLALVIGLIFVGFVVPKMMVNNLIQFMSVGLFVIFIVLILWGFISGNSDLAVSDKDGKKIHKLFAVLIFGSLVFTIIWISGLSGALFSGLMNLFNNLFYSSWSSTFWSNFMIVLIILVVIFVAIGFNPFNKKMDPWIKLK